MSLNRGEKAQGTLFLPHGPTFSRIPLGGFGAGNLAFGHRDLLVGCIAKDKHQDGSLPFYRGASLGGALRKTQTPN